MSFGGVDPRNGERFGLTDIVAGGGGARPAGDGVEVVDTDVSNCMNIPAEAIEMDYPIRVRSYRLRRDGGGAGRERGGVGVERILEATRGEMVCSYRSERHFTAPWGLFGGQSGGIWRTEVMRADGSIESVPSKQAFVLRAGDALRMLAGGGGGYGSPHTREPARVRNDVADGKVSVDGASSHYGIVLDDAGNLDGAASKLRRAALEQADLERAQLHGRAGHQDAIFDRGLEVAVDDN